MAHSYTAIALFAVIIVLAIFVIFIYVRSARINGEDYDQRQLRIHYGNTTGDAFTAAAQRAIDIGEHIENPRAIDSFRVGAVYLVNAKDAQSAHRHFNHALRDIIRGTADPVDAEFVLQRITDYDVNFIELTAEHDLPLQEAIMAQGRMAKKELKRLAKKKANIRKEGNDPEFTQKMILARQAWHQDAQNVHDSSLYLELIDQFQYVATANREIANVADMDYTMLKKDLDARFRGSPELNAKIKRALARIDKNAVVGIIPKIREQAVACAVFRRAHDPQNKANRVTILESLGRSLADCIEDGNVVCMAGRVSRVWASLAMLDDVPVVGVLKTKQVMRNEFYARAASTVDGFIGERGTASHSLRDAYNQSVNRADVKELEESMREAVRGLRSEFAKRMTDEELSEAMTVCLAQI